MNQFLLPELSLYLLCYNEERNIANTFNKSLPILKKIAKKWEIVFVDDGSTDKSADILSHLKQSDPSHIKIITHQKNRGYGAAFKSGAYNCRYQWITFIDGDGQFDFSEITNFISSQKKTHADLVIGYYKKRRVSNFRIWGSSAWQLAVYLLFGLKVKDIDCGFKFYNKKVLDIIPHLEAERGPFISSEFLIKAKKMGFKIVEIGVHHYPRVFGEATGSKLNVVLAGFKDLLSLWYKLNFKFNDQNT
jgi:glycosyltransferase involved in cell wall biosynthesis